LGYYIPSSPQTLVFKMLVDVDWDEHFSENELTAFRAFGMFMDYTMITGFIKLAGLNLPFASSRAAVGTSFSWLSFFRSPYALPVAAYALAFVGMVHHADLMIAEDPFGRPSVVQSIFDDHTRGKFQP
jgi:hypothetical protein